MTFVPFVVQARWIGRLCLGVALVGTSLDAQQALRTPREIAQIIDAALQGVIPPEKQLADRTVAERGVRFDYQRTMAAFGYTGDLASLSSFGLRSTVTSGTKELLSDCDQSGFNPCTRLGRAAYVNLQPMSSTDSTAIVVLHVVWATTLDSGVKDPATRTFMSAFSTEVYLARSGAGAWTFVRTGKTAVS